MLSNCEATPQVKLNNIVLLASGYNHEWLKAICDTANSFGEELDFVGLSKDVFSTNNRGYAFSFNPPRFLLSEVLETVIPKLLIIPDGRSCFMQLFVDPRVHHLISKTVSMRGKIGMSAGAQLILPRLPSQFQISPSHLHVQKNLAPTEFARHMFSL